MYATSHPLLPCSLCHYALTDDVTKGTWSRRVVIAAWNGTSLSSLESAHRWHGHVVEETGAVKAWVMKIPLFSVCSDIRTLVLRTFASAALTCRDNSPCFNDACVRSPHTTTIVETSNNPFRSYNCTDICAQLRRNLKGRRGSFVSRRIVACFSFTRFSFTHD